MKAPLAAGPRLALALLLPALLALLLPIGSLSAPITTKQSVCALVTLAGGSQEIQQLPLVPEVTNVMYMRPIESLAMLEEHNLDFVLHMSQASDAYQLGSTDWHFHQDRLPFLWQDPRWGSLLHKDPQGGSRLLLAGREAGWPVLLVPVPDDAPVLLQHSDLGANMLPSIPSSSFIHENIKVLAATATSPGQVIMLLVDLATDATWQVLLSPTAEPSSREIVLGNKKPSTPWRGAIADGAQDGAFIAWASQQLLHLTWAGAQADVVFTIEPGCTIQSVVLTRLTTPHEQDLAVLFRDGSLLLADVVFTIEPGCTIQSVVLTRLTTPHEQDLAVLFRDGSLLLVRGFRSAGAVFHWTRLPAGAPATGTLVAPEPRGMTAPLGRLLYVAPRDPGIPAGYQNTWQLSWAPAAGAPPADMWQWEKLDLPGLSSGVWPRFFRHRTMQDWLLEANGWLYLGPSQFECAIDHTIVCSTATSNTGWLCQSGRELSPMVFDRRLCTGCVDGSALQPTDRKSTRLCQSGRELSPMVFDRRLCTGCVDGSALQPTHLSASACLACVVRDCLVCTPDQQCLICAKGFMLLSDRFTGQSSCVETCPAGTTASDGDLCAWALKASIMPTPSSFTGPQTGYPEHTRLAVQSPLGVLPSGTFVLNTDQQGRPHGVLILPTSEAGPLAISQSTGPAGPIHASFISTQFIPANTLGVVSLGPTLVSGSMVLVTAACVGTHIALTQWRCSSPVGSPGPGTCEPNATTPPTHGLPCTDIRQTDATVAVVRGAGADVAAFFLLYLVTEEGTLSAVHRRLPFVIRPAAAQHAFPVVFPAMGGTRRWVLLPADPLGRMGLLPVDMLQEQDPRLVEYPYDALRTLDEAQLGLATGRRDWLVPVVLSTDWRSSQHADALVTGLLPDQAGGSIWLARHLPGMMRPHGRFQSMPARDQILLRLPGVVPGGPTSWRVLSMDLGIGPYPSMMMLLAPGGRVFVSLLFCQATGVWPVCALEPALELGLLPPGAASQLDAVSLVRMPTPEEDTTGGGQAAVAADPPIRQRLFISSPHSNGLLVTLSLGECPAGSHWTGWGGCQMCDHMCLECDGPGPGSCLSCRYGGSTPAGGSGTCEAVCPAGQYVGPDACLPCPGECATCMALGPVNDPRPGCTSCPPGFLLDPGAGGLPGPAGLCMPCSPACATCTRLDDDTACDACAAGYFRKRGGACVLACPDGEFGSADSGQCEPCSAGCTACTEAQECTRCAEGRFLQGGVCPRCDGSCAACTGPAACTVCQAGLAFEDPSPGLASLCTGVCLPGDYLPGVPGPGDGPWRCATCAGTCDLCAETPDACRVCAAGHRWAGPSAPTGQATGPCVPCPTECSSCTVGLGPGAPDRCLSCGGGWFLTREAACVGACPAGMFGDLASGTCQPCAVECAQCGGPAADQCTECAGGLDLVPAGAGQTCVSGCPAGQYRQPGTADCHPCNEACAECNGPSDRDCWRCTGLVLQDGECVQECAARHAPVAARCLPCHPSCGACSGTRSTDCLTCGSGLLELGTRGVDLRCLASCPVGFSPATGAAACVTCPENCVRCAGAGAGAGSSGSTCDQCARGWLRAPAGSEDGLACVDTCPEGTFPYSGACSRCHDTCGACFGPGPGHCWECAPGAPLRAPDDTCVGVCPAGSFEAPAGSSDSPAGARCQVCHALCGPGCTGPGDDACTACPPGRLLAGGRCLTACPAGSYATPEAVCRACAPECAQCAGPEAAACTACPPGRFLTRAEQCLDTCPGGEAPCHVSGRCVPCPAGCAGCVVSPASGPADPCAVECVACDVGLVLSRSGACLAGCPAGEFLPTGGLASAGPSVCAPCQAPCRTCTGTAERCTSCSLPGEGWLVPEAGQCAEAGCPAGRAPVSRPADPPGIGPARVCLACPIHCEVCERAANGDLPADQAACRLPAPAAELVCAPVVSCDRCQHGYLLLRGGGGGGGGDGGGGATTCVGDCPRGYYAALGTGPAAVDACLLCVAGCAACAGPLSEDCTEWAGLSPKGRLAVGLGVGLGILFLLLLILVVLALVYFLRRRNGAKPAGDGDDFDSTVLNTIVELSLPGSILVNIGADFAPLPGESLGAGTQASVYAARAVGAGISDRLACPSTVAIKRMKDGQSRSAAQMALFQNEVALMWLLRDQPGLVRLYGYSDSPPSLVMDLYQADLATLLHSEITLSTHQVLGMVQDWATGLEAMHAHGIAHCDIKPGNVFVRQEHPAGPWRAALGDLGTSRNLSTERSSALTVTPPALNALTARYAAPEVFVAFDRKQALEKDLCLQADIYSAALLLWECLSRQVPWQGLDFAGISEAVQTGVRPEVGPAVAAVAGPQAASLGDLLSLCWDTDPQTRPLAASLRQRVSMAAVSSGRGCAAAGPGAGLTQPSSPV
ncbi:TKL protein kinase [Fonticula alba]|uniref:TKL protein kinase n=1 Tax=Fonticula alba TaxID=691883 RepID=A0A058Z9F8_FONAL|nr:TKL protein kinase [Fonticula alba]KCV70944.1 TKL protein kinase [Fonticula alba]|eukprot:XP_009494067.1 TKL protein kinase [Fonticula alba]